MEKTTDYKIFKFSNVNAPVKARHVHTLVESIRIKNMLHLRPVHVNENMEIIDGQHRVKAAEILKVPIYYIIDRNLEEEDMARLNANARIWKIPEYIHHFSARHFKEYERLNAFLKKYKIDFNLFKYLAGMGGSAWSALKAGRFVFPEAQKEKLEVIILSLNACIQKISDFQIKKDPFTKSKKFHAALILLIKKDGFILDVFIKKLEFLIDKLHRRSDSQGYLTLLLEIYNYRNSSPLE